MEESKQSLEEQSSQNISGVENIDNLEIQKKLDTLKNSELKELFGFDKFINYLSNQNNILKLDEVISIFESDKGKEKLLDYFDIDNVKGKGFFTDDSSYNKFINDFTSILNKQKIIKLKNDIEAKKDDLEAKKDDVEAKKDHVEAKKDDVEAKKDDDIKKLEERKQKYNEVKKVFGKHTELTGILNDITNSEKNWSNTDDIKKEQDPKKIEILLEKTNKEFETTLNLLKNKQAKIFEILFKEAKQTGNYNDVKQVADNFLKLEIIDQTRYDELQDIIGRINSQDDVSEPVTPPVPPTPGYTSRGDTLYKQTDKASFTIKDGKMISVSRESGFKLVNYNSLDKDGKALAEKMKFQAEIKELNNDLTDNESKRKTLNQISLLIQNKDPNSISDTDINNITSEIANNIPLLKETAFNIGRSNEKNDKKLEYIIKLLYGNITGSTNTYEIEGKEPIYMVYTCNEKLELSNYEINKKLEKAKKEIELIQEKFPNLDEKAITEKIKNQENRMQDTIKFCDDYGLSALGHIAYIKRVIVEFNKKEVDNQIPLDIGTGTDFMLKDNLPIYRKHMAKLLGRKENEIYRSDEKGLLDYDKTNQEPTTKNYLEKLLKERGVLNKKTGELNIYKVQELLEEGDTPDLEDEHNHKKS